MLLSFNFFSSRKYEELERNLKNIDINKLIFELTAEKAKIKAYLDNNKANSAFNKNKKSARFCKYCKKNGYIEESYYKKYPELIPKNSEQENNQLLIVL